MIDDEIILERVSAWGQTIKGFRHEHAIEAIQGGKLILQGLRGKGGDWAHMPARCSTQDAAFAFVAEMALLFWLDDCYDLALLADDELALAVAVLTGREHAAPAHLKGCEVIRQTLAEYAASAAEYQNLLEHTAAYAHALATERERSADNCSYSEYLENGIASIGYHNVLGCLSLLWGLGMPEQMRSTAFRATLRRVCIIGRLQNDLHTAAEECVGPLVANAASVVARMTSAFPVAFVEQELAGHGRLLDRHLATQPLDETWQPLVTILRSIRESYYEKSVQRYRRSSQDA